ncbi:heme lyase CcmF/NrfE family subunit [Pseudoduganella sp. R-34]|uniref:heme lyase CcmF/NrfE family subunit n=1 Tax=Pseudoduganella sp. R-34 TaxID=3404062 RepID=UPI003CEE24DD
MIAEAGNFALVLALLLAAVQGILPLAGARRGDVRWMALARPAAAGQFIFSTLAFGCLFYALYANDFSLRYVAQHSNTLLPWQYRLSAAWGGHEGSLLLWTWLLSAWTFAAASLSRQLPREVQARLVGVLGLVAVGFLLFLILTSNPFLRMLPAAPDGNDLNPLLQDAGMIAHPPLLYMGYVGFSVTFAFAIAALLGGRLDASWARWSRPWALAAWSFLTLGIAMGSFWAYYELGWGGWWFWDAVENASFMPWLVGTALLHSLIVTEKRGTFRSWTALLAILAFSLSLLGTFLVRSGVLTSVHAFATDPRRGAFILAYLAVVVGGSLLLYAWRAPRLRQRTVFSPMSRESLLLLQNVVMLAATGTVLLGTLYPLVLDALGAGKISVGPPYFEKVFLPMMLPVLLLVAAGPFAGWRNGTVAQLARRLRWPAAMALGIGLGAALLVRGSLMSSLGLLLAAWVLLGTAWQVIQQRRKLARQPRSWWGMMAAHAGLGVFVIGVTMVKGHELVQDVVLAPGQQASLGEYSFTLQKLENTRGPNYTALRASVTVAHQGQAVARLQPEQRRYTVAQDTMTEAAIDRGLLRDLYVSLGDSAGDGRWLLRIQLKPFVGWIWGGCVLFAIGGLLAASDRRYRSARQSQCAMPDTAAAPALAASSLLPEPQ